MSQSDFHLLVRIAIGLLYFSSACIGLLFVWPTLNRWQVQRKGQSGKTCNYRLEPGASVPVRDRRAPRPLALPQ